MAAQARLFASEGASACVEDINEIGGKQVSPEIIEAISNPDNYQRRLDVTPLGRFQIPADIAKAFLSLASDDASMFTGVNLKVDGSAGI